MIMYDVLFSEALSFKEIGKVFLEILELDREQFVITENIASFVRTDRVRVVCESVRIDGDEFPCLINIYCYESYELPEKHQLLKYLAFHLQCSCLILDESENPYGAILFCRNGETNHVSLDIELLDEKGVYVVANSGHITR